MNDSARRLVMLVAIGGALIALLVGGLTLLDWREVAGADDVHVVAFVATLGLSGALWLLAVAIVRRGRLPACAIWLVLLVATTMRLLTLFAPPMLSSDVYRYVWDGRVQIAGINPYSHMPIAEELAFLRDAAVFPHINRADYAYTIYPPAAQAIFALAGAVMPTVFGMKLMMAAFDALAIGALFALLRIVGRDPAELLIYAWLPLPIWEFAGNAHIDGAAAGLLALALLLAARNRSVITGIVLAAATLTKFLPAVVLPAFWRPRDWRLPAVFAVTLVALYLPYIGIGWRAVGFLGGYASEEGFASGRGIFVLQLLDRVVPLPEWAPKAYVVFVLAVLAALALRFCFVVPLPAAPGARIAAQARQAVILSGVLLTALSPHYPWYFGWLAPLVCLAPIPAALWMLAAAPLLAHGSFEYLAIPGAVYGPAAALVLFELYRRWTKRLTLPQAVRSA